MRSQRVVNFGNMFVGRLYEVLLKGALAYVEYNEEPLAFEILCDHISEYNVRISNVEYDESMQLALEMGFDIKNPPFKYLKELIG